MGTTVRRGTKQHEAALASATHIKCYSLDNYFSGKEMREDNPDLIMPPRDWLRRELDRFNFAKLSTTGDGHYTLRVHGNLWYEFEAAA